MLDRERGTQTVVLGESGMCELSMSFELPPARSRRPGCRDAQPDEL
jgi:hypothetical protein